MSLADEAPYLLTSTSSLADLNVRLEKRGAKPVDMRRFRPNIVISGFKVFIGQADRPSQSQSQSQSQSLPLLILILLPTLHSPTLHSPHSPLSLLSARS